MIILPYNDHYRDAVIALILHIQNDEAGVSLTLDDQPDLLHITDSYTAAGGGFWLATEDDVPVGTIGIMNAGNGNAVLKKFFVRADQRRQGVGPALYETAMSFVQSRHFRRVLLDTPSVAKASHRFYERAGFVRIAKDALPFAYTYPDRDSLLYLLELPQ